MHTPLSADQLYVKMTVAALAFAVVFEAGYFYAATTRSTLLAISSAATS